MADRVVSMDVRLAVAYFLQAEPSMTVRQFCDKHAISPQTYYRYRRRFIDSGGRLESLVPQPRRPHRSPTATPQAVKDRVVAKRRQLAREGLDAGARSVRAWLLREDPARADQVPSSRTIHRILHASGEIVAQPKKRPRSSFTRFAALHPNGCWQIDGMKHRLADGRQVTVLRVLDDHSRAVMASLACNAETVENAWQVIHTAIERHGAPAMLLSDGGSAFTQRRIHGTLGELEARLRQHGILPVVSSPYHPQTCGKKEREWQTQRRWLAARPTATTLTELQTQLDAYDLIYNHDRPHQAHPGHATPIEVYTATTKATPSPTPLAGKLTRTQVKVRRLGVVDLGNGNRASIGTEWAHTYVTIWREDPVIAIFNDTHLIEYFHLDPNRKYQLQRNRR